MLRPLSAALTLALACMLTGCNLIGHMRKDDNLALQAELAPHLDVLGARNWVVIADPAYPILAGEGVDVITVEADAARTLREVLRMLAADGSLKPRLWSCSELASVPEKRAPGITHFRNRLKKLTARHLHYEVTDRIIALQLAQAAQTYRILYIKTDTPLPYSSVAIELDSGYWNSSDEAELRQRMERLNSPTPPRPLPRIGKGDYSDPEA